MAELEPGHPDELRNQLANWIEEAMSPIGSLPAGVTVAEWAARNFIDAWRKPVRQAIDSIEGNIKEAVAAIRDGKIDSAIAKLDAVRQEIEEGLRDDLGLYDWN